MQIEDWPSARSLPPLYKETEATGHTEFTAVIAKRSSGTKIRFPDLYRKRAHRKTAK